MLLCLVAIEWALFWTSLLGPGVWVFIRAWPIGEEWVLNREGGVERVHKDDTDIDRRDPPRLVSGNWWTVKRGEGTADLIHSTIATYSISIFGAGIFGGHVNYFFLPVNRMNHFPPLCIML